MAPRPAVWVRAARAALDAAAARGQGFLPYGKVRYGMVWYGMVWCGVVWYPACHPSPYHPILIHTILSHPIPSHHKHNWPRCATKSHFRYICSHVPITGIWKHGRATNMGQDDFHLAWFIPRFLVSRLVSEWAKQASAVYDPLNNSARVSSKMRYPSDCGTHFLPCCPQSCCYANPWRIVALRTRTLRI